MNSKTLHCIVFVPYHIRNDNDANAAHANKTKQKSQQKKRTEKIRKQGNESDQRHDI